MPNITHREAAAVLLWAAVMVVLTGIPYILAASWAGPGRYFGGFIWGVDEGNVYLSWIRQASEGRWLLANQYTTVAQRPHFFNVFLLALGRLCRYTGLRPVEAFHLARLVGIPFALYSFYCLVAYLTATRLVRAAALAVASLSSGFGWLWTVAAQGGARVRVFPPDCAAGWQAMPEAVTFLSLLLNPVFTWSLGLICLALLWAWRGLERGRLLDAAVAGVLVLVLGNVHSYDIFVVHGAIVFWAAYLVASHRLPLWRAAGTYMLIWLVALPAPLWALYAARSDPAYWAKAMTPTLSPSLASYAAGYGLIGAAAVIGAAACWLLRRLHPRLMAPVMWAVVGLAMVYAPVSFQRKLIEGEHLALSFLAAVGLVVALPWLLWEQRAGRALSATQRWAARRRVALGLVGGFLVATVPSNVVFVSRALGHVAVNNADLLSVLMPPAYLTADEVAALQWLAKRTSFDDVVLSSSLIGNYIPAWAPARVVAGHWAETLNFSARVQTVAEFYAPGLSPLARRQILHETGATYVWWGQYERTIQRSMASVAQQAIGHEPPLPDQPDRGLNELTVAFRKGDVVIYRVVRPEERRWK